jgi:hypothetical protein
MYVARAVVMQIVIAKPKTLYRAAVMFMTAA